MLIYLLFYQSEDMPTYKMMPFSFDHTWENFFFAFHLFKLPFWGAHNYKCPYFLYASSCLDFLWYPLYVSRCEWHKRSGIQSMYIYGIYSQEMGSDRIRLGLRQFFLLLHLINISEGNQIRTQLMSLLIFVLTSKCLCVTKMHRNCFDSYVFDKFYLYSSSPCALIIRYPFSWLNHFIWIYFQALNKMSFS